MPTISEPQTERLNDRAIRFDLLYRQYLRTGGVEGISDATYLRSLFIDGIKPDEANARLNLLKMEARR